MTDPIHVFIGGTREHEIPTAVLAHSILARTSREVVIRPLHLESVPIPVPVDPANRQVTTFSFQRFIIPEALGFTGRGIYLDSDMLVFGDIGELWDTPFPPGSLVQMCPGWQSAVMLIDAAVGWKISELVARLDAGTLSYKNMVNVKALGQSTDSLDWSWNCMDNYPDGCRLLHFTHMDSQPWLTARHELGRAWEAAFVAAFRDGMVTAENVHDAIRLQWVRPSLAGLIGEEAPYDDSAFVFPHRRRKRGEVVA